MAVKKKDSPTPSKKPIAEVRKENEELHEQIRKLEEGAYCYLCDTHKPKSSFYQSTDPNAKSGIVSVCKKCISDIVFRKDENGYHDPTKASVMAALEYIDKPFLQKVWDSSYFEAHNSTGKKLAGPKSIWGSYIKTINSLHQYKTLRWRDSDIFKSNAVITSLDAALPSSQEKELIQQKMDRQKEAMQECEKNRHDVIRIFGYDPFEFEDEADKPLLYAKVVRMCDTSDDSEDDEIKLSSILEVVRGYNQLEKINRQINMLNNIDDSDIGNLNKLKTLYQMQKDKVSAINALAKESKLTKASSDNTTKGSNTWTGKVKLLKEMNLREEEVNAFEVETCKGMRQVAELSSAAILNQINLDENDYADMLKEQRILITKLRDEKRLAEERQRILYRENRDLKTLLAEKKIEIEQDLQSNHLFEVDTKAIVEESKDESEANNVTE